MKVLVTGGAGYIGSHTCVELMNSGHEVVVIDNLINSEIGALKCVEQITGKKLSFYQADVREQKALEKIFTEHEIDAVIHFAGLKAVGESVSLPLEYYENNLGATFSLLKAMKLYGCRNIIFSSSATVYGENDAPPFAETMPKGNCTNPYGWTKWMIEQILSDFYKADNTMNVTVLRYFNPIGAHKSGLIGENPRGIPNNLLPYVAQVAVGKIAQLGVFGTDYDTPDGTGVRDYIHVVDLACGHVAALSHMQGYKVYNLGTGKGYSVLEVVAAFERACGHKIPYKVMPRRAGDIAACYSNPEKAERELSWRAKYDLEDMCRDAWHFQSLFKAQHGQKQVSDEE